MNTRILAWTQDAVGASRIREAAGIIRQGGLVAFPTETVYGLGADGLNPQAVEEIFRCKGRPQDNPLILHVDSLDMARDLTTDFPASARVLADRFWPGPLTLVLPRAETVPAQVSAGLPTVAVRMPAHPAARELITAVGGPVAAPSANLSGRPSPTSAVHCYRDLNGKIPLILDGGECIVGLESTVLSLTGDIPRLLRPGSVTLEQLEEALGRVLVDPAVLEQPEEGAKVSSPGMKYKHYAPNARVILVKGDEGAFYRYVNEHAGKGVFVLAFDEDMQKLPQPIVSLGSRNRPEEWAAALFAALRELDERGAEIVYVPSPPREGVGLAVYNRLIRAAAFNEVVVEQ